MKYLKLTFYIVFLLPGTIVHELMHFIIGLIFIAKPTNFSVIPRIEKNKITLGNVKFININNINAFPIAIAPLFIIFIIYLMDLYYFKINNIYTYTDFLNYILSNLNNKEKVFEIILIIYLNITLLFSSLPSPTDLKVALKYPIGTFLWIVLIFVSFKYFFKLF